MAQNPEEENTNNTGGFEGHTSNQVDRSASGLQYQAFSLEKTAQGVNGIARRTVVSPNALFSHHISSAQFGDGEDAQGEM